MNTETKRVKLRSLFPRLRTYRRRFLQSVGASDRRLLDKEISAMLKANKNIRVTIDENAEPLLGGALASLSADEMTADGLLTAANGAAARFALRGADIDTLLWQTKFSVLKHAESDTSAAAKIFALSDIDGAEFLRINPIERVLRQAEGYTLADERTRALYRTMTAEVAEEIGIDESRLAGEYVRRSVGRAEYGEVFAVTGTDGGSKVVPLPKQPRDVGEIIGGDFRLVFPYRNLRRYIMSLLLLIGALSAALSWVTGTGAWGAVVSYFAIAAVVKPIADIVTIKTTKFKRRDYAVDLKEIPDAAKTLVAISTLVSSEEDIAEGVAKLRAAKIKNRGENIGFCLLCDLPPSKHETSETDETLLSFAEKAVCDKEDGFVVLIRKRSFSKTQRKWQGEERKRGALLSLMRLLRPDGKPKERGFSLIAGDLTALDGVRFVCALDFDTVPTLGGVKDLVAVALHPANRRFGIISPRITVQLSAYLRTGFSRVMAGCGGSAGASSYDCFSSELYQDCFGEGTFTGKGLINVDLFLDKCGENAFARERVLSHDILEGGACGVLFAGGVEFSDGFPPNSAAYFARQHRWYRGDLQNFSYVFDGRFSGLTRWKLFDNARRAATPFIVMLCLFYGVWFAEPLFVLTGFLALITPFFTGFVPGLARGGRYALKRRFYSPVATQVTTLLRQCALELVLAPKAALVSLDAAVGTMWRMLLSKRGLLDWTVSSAFEKKRGGFSHLLTAEALGVAFLALSAYRGDMSAIVIGLFFSSVLPIMAWADGTRQSEHAKLSDGARFELEQQAEMMFEFYEDYVNAETRFLPPDNVQYSPVYRVCFNTSPTNIGMYLLAIVSAQALGYITPRGMTERAAKTISTIEKLEKWRGNLFNWYDTKTLKVISPFVSSVDSGNFLACLIVLKQSLLSVKSPDDLVFRVEKLISSTDIGAFYDKKRKLFSIGYDTDEQAFSRHKYDLLMSEARLTSYVAVALGAAGREHWQALGRTMGKCGRFAAPVAWTGTCFEYFMPEIFLSSKEGGAGYEAIRYSLYVQKKRAEETGLPYGVSESGYYAFDRMLNYQYKAHGTDAAALKAGMNRERVISPYSTYLTLSLDPIGAFNNLAKLQKLGLFHERYGFYEAADFTKRRTGGGYALVKSHMAHHVGMSIAGATNALLDGRIRRLFMSDERMAAASEFLEEEIIIGETVLDSPKGGGDDPLYDGAATYVGDISRYTPRARVVSNGAVSLIMTDTGVYDCYFGGVSVWKRTDDLYHPRGNLFALCENDRAALFFADESTNTKKNEYSVQFLSNCAEYYRNFRGIRAGMQVFALPNIPAEIRRFAVENTGGTKRILTLAAYLEPMLSSPRDFTAHPAFSDMFLKAKWLKAENLVIFSRKERTGDKEIFAAVGFVDVEQPYTFSFDRERVEERNGGIFSAFHCLDGGDGGEAVSPCALLGYELEINPHSQVEAVMFACFGDTEADVIETAEEIRDMEDYAPGPEVTSPLPPETVRGRLSETVLPYLLWTPLRDETAVRDNRLSLSGLWRFGISGDVPLITVSGGGDTLAYAAELKKSLSACGVQFDVAAICKNSEAVREAQATRGEAGTEIFVIDEENTDKETLSLIHAFSRYEIKSLELQSEQTDTRRRFPVIPCEPLGLTGNGNRFEENGLFIIEEPTDTPWCNVLANSSFGCLVSERSLGFSWAFNSRENKLTPWQNDLCADNKGEMLLLSAEHAFVDIVDGAVTLFSPNRAAYRSAYEDLAFTTEVNVYKKGAAKEITVTVTNKSAKEVNTSLAFYTEPVLGVERTASRFVSPEVVSKHAALLRQYGNGALSGAMCLAVNRECGFTFGRDAFFTRDNTADNRGGLIAAATVPLKLPPKHTDKIKFILSFTKNMTDPLSLCRAVVNTPYADAPRYKTDCEFKDFRFAEMATHWLPWQALGARIYARTGFYQNSGAFGFRDQLQDALAVCRFDKDAARRQIVRHSAAQFREGDVLHWWHDIMGGKRGVRTRYCDDLLWLPYVLAEYVATTGDADILGIKTRFLDAPPLRPNEHERYFEVNESEETADIYEHAKRALEHGFKTGEHGLILMGGGDWCDGYNEVGIGGKGESVWGSMFYALAAERFALISAYRGDTDYRDTLINRSVRLKQNLDTEAWEKDRYIRGFYDDGSKLGSVASRSCKLDLLPQVFASLCSMPDKDRVNIALDTALRELFDENGGVVRLFSPPFSRENTDERPGYVASYPSGVRENGGQYTHAAVWLGLALVKADRMTDAKRVAKAIAPFGRNENYKTEPYYLAADIYTNPSMYGRGGWSIYTGSAGWYLALLEACSKN
ncbi:MAG: hypothetical protein LBN40_00855 [Oscillospiraceae bacterium]|nr:hypothetical protein [Oscillospiraceae bacterium]